jgi:hypothetical protein
VAGRQSTSFRNTVGKVSPIVFSKAGAQTVAALAEKRYNTGNTPLRVRKVVASLGTAPTGASFVVDVKVNGTSVFAAAGDRATITATNTTGSAVPSKTDLDVISVLPGQYLTVEVTQVGSSVAGSDLRVEVFAG